MNTQTAATGDNSNIDSEPNSSNATVLLMVGMAGTGKTSLMQRINSHLSQKKHSKYLINLDPAVLETPFPCNIDIRDTVDYQKVRKEYSLGPNGGILTCLNLFTTKFDQVLDLLAKKKREFVLIDTPGQIEIFTWSASGQIITESISQVYPTVIIYTIDTPRSTSPVTFMSNMLYAVSILYKCKLPFVLVFNKTDVVDCDFCFEWMRDFETFQLALESDTTYMGTLVSSMCLVLQEFYEHLRVVGVSAVTGAGMEELFEQIGLAHAEYHEEYLPMIKQRRQDVDEKEALKRQQDLEKLMKDIQV